MYYWFESIAFILIRDFVFVFLNCVYPRGGMQAYVHLETRRGDWVSRTGAIGGYEPPEWVLGAGNWELSSGLLEDQPASALHF